jgi:hypothetical protein
VVRDNDVRRGDLNCVSSMLVVILGDYRADEAIGAAATKRAVATTAGCGTAVQMVRLSDLDAPDSSTTSFCEGARKMRVVLLRTCECGPSPYNSLSHNM